MSNCFANEQPHLHSMQFDFIDTSIEKVVLWKNYLFKFSEILVQHRKYLAIHQLGSIDLNEENGKDIYS